MKKVISILLVLAMVFCFAACGSSSDDDGMSEQERYEKEIKKFNTACDTIQTAVVSAITEEYVKNPSATTIGEVPDAEESISNDVGERVVIGDSVGDADYCVNADANSKAMTVKNERFTGVWDGESWTVSEN